MTVTHAAAALVSVIALRTVKFAGVRRVPGTESESFDLPADLAADLVNDGTVRLGDPEALEALRASGQSTGEAVLLRAKVEALERDLADRTAELANVTAQFNNAGSAIGKLQDQLDQAVIERDQARAEVPVLRQQFEQAQADLARVEGELAAATKPAADAAGQEGGDAAAPAKTAKGAK